MTLSEEADVSRRARELLAAVREHDPVVARRMAADGRARAWGAQVRVRHQPPVGGAHDLRSGVRRCAGVGEEITHYGHQHHFLRCSPRPRLHRQRGRGRRRPWRNAARRAQPRPRARSSDARSSRSASSGSPFASSALPLRRAAIAPRHPLSRHGPLFWGEALVDRPALISRPCESCSLQIISSG